MRCIFHDLMTLKSANADGVFQCLDKIFSDDSPIKYSKLFIRHWMKYLLE